MVVTPFVMQAVTRELRYAAESHEGRKLTDSEVTKVIQREVDALLKRWTKLGAWIIHLDNWHPVVRRKLSGITINNPKQEERDRRSATMKAVWAAKRAKGERLPQRVPSREFGQRAAWRTKEQKIYQAKMQKIAWDKRKAKEA